MLHQKILAHRKRMGLSQEELAARLGVSRQAVSKWELGTSTPDPSNIVALAKLFGITTDELLMDEPQQQTYDPQPPPNAPQPSTQNDFLDRLPGFLGRIIRKYSWLAGIYLMLGGLAFLLVGLFARSAHNSMFSSIPSVFADSIVSDSPFTMLSTIALVLGGIFTLTGLILAIVLYKKRPK